MKKRKEKNKNQSGFIALTSVIISSAFIVVLFIGMFLSATENINRVDDREFATRALGLANSCAEEALNNLKNNSAYGGNETVNIGIYTCEVLLVDSVEDMRVIKAKGDVNGYVKRVQVEVDITNHPSFEIMDWRIVSEFTDA